ncbi:MAG: 3-keto-5-aminohexanoate cleavage protein [Peptostreptococcaceae bacterium]|nr:3-keto-5-aminohexanoate cleavage protein [Peptostreptococcaceae bacterium]
MSKRIISCSITGSIHVPSMSQYLPITPEEIVQNVIDAANAGAASVHIHARNPVNGQPSADLEIFQKIIDKVRQVNKDVIICITTGGGVGMTVEQRVSVVPRFKPELASMNAGSFNWGLFPAAEKLKQWKYEWEKPALEMTKGFVFQNTFADMEKMLNIFNENGTKPELECYDVGHIYNVKFMKDAGLIKGKPYLQFVLGINGAIGSSPYDLITMKETADRVLGIGEYEWSAFGAGKQEYPICMQSLLLGGNVRVGLEDNLYLEKGKLAKNNAQLVEKMARIMKEFDFEIATPDEAREILGLNK